MLAGHHTPVQTETELLLRHLHHLLPEVAASASNPFQTTTTTTTTATSPAAAAARSLLGDAAQGELVLSILIDFWLSDEEVRPLPIAFQGTH